MDRHRSGAHHRHRYDGRRHARGSRRGPERAGRAAGVRGDEGPRPREDRALRAHAHDRSEPLLSHAHPGLQGLPRGDRSRVGVHRRCEGARVTAKDTRLPTAAERICALTALLSAAAAVLLALMGAIDDWQGVLVTVLALLLVVVAG